MTATAIRAAVVTTVKSDPSALAEAGCTIEDLQRIAGAAVAAIGERPADGQPLGKEQDQGPEDDRCNRQAREQPAVEAGAQMIRGKAEIEVGEIDDVDGPDRHPERVGESARLSRSAS